MGRHGALDVLNGSCGSRCGGCACARAGSLVLVVRDTELSRVLVLSSAVYNQLNAVVCLVGSKAGVRSPVIAASVVDALDNGVNGYTVGGGTVEKNKRNRALSVRFPSNCERLADRNDAVKTRFIDGVASRVTLGSCVGRGQGSKGSEASGE